MIVQFAACLLFLTVPLCALGQGPPTKKPEAVVTPTSSDGNIRGRVALPNGQLISTALKITLSSIRGAVTTQYTDDEGQFELDNLTPGNYTISAEGDVAKFDVVSASVEVNKNATTLVTLNLREKTVTTSTNPGGKSVSVGENDPGIPARAQEEFQKGSKASRDGRKAEAIDHFQKAILIYPKYMMALNDLGAEFLGQGQLDDAEEALEKAIQIDPKAFNPLLNLGIVLYRKHAFKDALDSLNAAIALQSDSAAAHFNRGLTHMALEDRQNAIRDLKTAHDLGGAVYSVALFRLGQVYMDLGQKELALSSFQNYLRESPNAENAAEAKQMVEMLR